MMWWHEGGWDAGGWLLMSLMMVLFWGGLVVLAAWLLQSVRGDANRGGTPSTVGKADEVLAERFARGEIDEVEFQRRRDLLHPGAPG